MKNLRKIGIVLSVILLIAISVGVYLRKEIKALYTSLNSFRTKNLAHTFQHTPEIQPVNTVHKGTDTFLFEKEEPMALPYRFSFLDQEYSVEGFLRETKTTGFLVIKDDVIKYERYDQGGDENTVFSSNSMGKSFVSALMGIAISERYVNSVDDSLGTYISEFRGTELERIPIKACLQMASGIDFDEDADMSKFSFRTLLGSPAINVIAKYGKVEEPFTHRKYLSINTEILGEVIVQATGRSLSDYMEEKLWKKIGVQQDAHWTLSNGKELAMGGLNISLRDYARFGRLYLNGGNYNGEQVVPEQWVKDSLNADADYSRPGADGDLGNAIGYGYQWWIPEGNETEFIAIGVYGQWLYVNPTRNTIIVKTSADPDFNAPENDIKNVEFLRGIAKSIS